MLLVHAIERHCCVISLLASLSSWKLDGIVEVRYVTSLAVEFLVYFWQSGERAQHKIIEELWNSGWCSLDSCCLMLSKG